MKTPFMTKGIYARKMNPEEELINYKPTKLKSMWKVAIGKKEEAFYQILKFSENYRFSHDDSKEKAFCAHYFIMSGEIFGLADKLKRHGCSYAKYKNVVFDEYRFVFVDENIKFAGWFDSDNILHFSIHNEETGESSSAELFRYIPWI